MRILQPPFGFTLTKEIDADNESDVLRLCLSLVDDTEAHNIIMRDTHEERLINLISNGFEIEECQNLNC